MPLTMQLWRVDEARLSEMPRVPLDAEKRLEEWIEQDSGLLGMALLFIGRQVRTAGGPIDLLALDGNGNLVVLELKRDKTPREVVAQALDYASCVKSWSPSEISGIFDSYTRKPAGQTLAQAFAARFGTPLPEPINQAHSVVIVASQLDDSSERIVTYLQNDLRVNINAIFFNVFRVGDQEIIARSWLSDPEQAAERAVEQAEAKKVQSGFHFVNVGEGEHRDWIDCQRYGFIAAGHGAKFSNALRNRLKVGDRVFAYMKQCGYVGYGTVRDEAVAAKEFTVGGQSIVDLDLHQPNIGHDRDDAEMCEWLVRVEWHKTFDKAEAKTFPGAFANPNIACRLQEGPTAEFLRKEFGA